MYKMRTLYTKRFDDVNNALSRARTQVQLYDQLRQDTLGTTTGMGAVVTQAQGTVDNLEQLRDSTLLGRRVYTDRQITRSTVVNAYNSVMAQAGLTPEPTAGVTKSVLIDRILGAGVDPKDLRDDASRRIKLDVYEGTASSRSHDVYEDASRRIKLDVYEDAASADAACYRTALGKIMSHS
ncbi:hypothetical protein AB1Y20_021164 [Prymnesium parvum]